MIKKWLPTLLALLALVASVLACSTGTPAASTTPEPMSLVVVEQTAQLIQTHTDIDVTATEEVSTQSPTEVLNIKAPDMKSLRVSQNFIFNPKIRVIFDSQGEAFVASDKDMNPNNGIATVGETITKEGHTTKLANGIKHVIYFDGKDWFIYPVSAENAANVKQAYIDASGNSPVLYICIEVGCPKSIPSSYKGSTDPVALNDYLLSVDAASANNIKSWINLVVNYRLCAEVGFSYSQAFPCNLQY